MYSKCLNSLQQVAARGGQPILICETGDVETQNMSGGDYIQIPHTVDCLQVQIKFIKLSRFLNIFVTREF